MQRRFFLLPFLLVALAAVAADWPQFRAPGGPIAHDGCLLLRTDLYLYCLGKK
jgi:hypothetical protein